ncbi:CBS domain-containing protein [Streptomyces sp. NPDC051582]|uniref:CBS domain-containing protein n=1 Tax=Streptomyces sp. NPDC051582 TaxID=3155167 RepID=UPI003415FDCC
MQSRTAGADPAHGTADEDAEQGCPRVGDDMTVEVALSVMASARAGHLLVCDEDGARTGLVTPARLAAARGSDTYTDRVRLRDILGDHEPFISPSHAQPPRGGRTVHPLPL